MPLNVAMSLSGLEPDQWSRNFKDFMEQVPPPLVDYPQPPHQVFLMSYPPSTSSGGSINGGSPLPSPPFEESSSCASSSSGFSSLLSLDSCKSFFSNDSSSSAARALLSSFGGAGGSASAGSASSSLSYRSGSTSESSSNCISPVLSAPGVTTVITGEYVRPASTKSLCTPLVVYQSRDLLDLNKNLRDPTWRFQYSEIKEGLESYWSNRSVISRLGNQYPPMPRMVRCMAVKDCNFQLPQFE